jgi:hypothetical protein
MDFDQACTRLTFLIKPSNSDRATNRPIHVLPNNLRMGIIFRLKVLVNRFNYMRFPFL